MTGSSVEEATEAALDELGVDASELEVEVLEEPRPGLFGRTRGTARVRARVAPTQPRPKVERRKRSAKKAGGRSSDKGGKKKPTSSDEAPPEAAADAEPPAAAVQADEAQADVAPEPAPDAEPAATKAGRSSTGGRSRRGRGGRSKDRTDSAEATDAPAEQGAAVSSVSVQEQTDVMQEFLEGLLDSFDVDGDISVVEIDDEMTEVQVEGEDLGLLIGPKGQTLMAVQDLARTVAQRQLPGPHEGRVRLDVSGYRQRRREALERFAAKVADDVLESGSRKVLEPMNAADRKVVHDVINDVDGVTTSSEGDDPRRYVVVEPDD